jgi:hypothetical protein
MRRFVTATVQFTASAMLVLTIVGNCKLRFWVLTATFILNFVKIDHLVPKTRTERGDIARQLFLCEEGRGLKNRHFVINDMKVMMGS